MLPALAMMIVFGSVHTMLNATQKSQMGANVDTKPTTPDTVKSDGKTLSGQGVSMTWDNNGNHLFSSTAGQVTSGAGTTFSSTTAVNNGVTAAEAEANSVSRTLAASRERATLAQQAYNTSLDANTSMEHSASAGATYERAVGESQLQSIASASGMSVADVKKFDGSRRSPR
ncbi:MAG: hypothetical protein LRY40_04720 [Shewanella fodinae]|nr:hypothetical protein [Shewanella fodinae]